ncbi:hypothetical protein [Pseudobacteroides cellulosolvens]|uniref:Uncharacterized protein n=1 Tax=Pseudobacteroides cellulosolvens ATCC 35603 = DSM 2933 TaxID=398512 RepID=A0A0L6JYJ2_9FIRM|nr:hypothetical protein [Pseudobacteroides cellulosolvens]KNY30590.1 hypothetical protein Bccel_5870 [Pseudobacteroides cellulosolvens ATCC 35603 = DSM 2933]KNY30597.1 hypothetical protein Bccel_5877 [Pseudobacteroides cellulosolvens ATCC 35603 = DSM 2933]
MINSTIKQDKKEFKDLLLLCVMLDWGFSFIMYGTKFTANEKLGASFITAIIAVCIGLPFWGIVLYYFKCHKFSQVFVLYFGVSTIVYSIMFFWIFYEVLYKIALIENAFYLILGGIGYITVVILILYYRYNINRGVYKDKSGLPKYTVIGVVALIGGIIFKAFMDKQSESIQNIALAVVALIISYAFSFGFTQLFSYWLILKENK